MNLQHPQLVLESHEEGQSAALLTFGDSALTLKDFYYHSPKARGEFREEVRTRMRGARETGCRFTALAGGAGAALHLFEADRVSKDPSELVKEVEQATSLGARDMAAMAFAANSGHAYAGTGDLLLATLPFRELDQLRELGKSMNCSDLRVLPAVLAALSAAGRRSLDKGERLWVVGVFAQETRLTLVEKGGVTRLVRVAYGQQGIFETIQAELGLKFVGSAAKLVYDGVYDFGEVAGKVVAPWAEAVKKGLGTDGASATLLLHLLPPTGPWIAETFAESLAMPLFAADTGLVPAKEGDLSVNPGQSALVPMWLAASGADEAAPFALADWQAAKPLPEVMANLPKAIKAAPAPASAATPKPELKKPAEKAPAPAPAAAKPAAKAKASAAPAKAPTPKPAAPVAAKAVVPAAPKTPVPAKGAKEEEKKPPFAIIGAVAAVLFLGVILFFVFGRGDDSADSLALAPATPAPAPAPVTPAPAPLVPQPAPAPVEAAPEAPPAPAPARLSLVTEPAGATVSLNGRSLGRTPLSGLELDAGSATLEISLDGFLSETVDVEMVPGETVTVNSLSLVRLAGGVIIESRPSGAIVRRDGERLGRTPLELSDLAPGAFTFSLEMDGFVPLEHTVDILHAETAQATGLELARQTGRLVVESQPAGIRFRVENSADSAVNHEGTTPMTLEALPVGSYRVLFERDEWPNFTRPARIQHGEATAVRMEYPEGRLRLTSNPSGAEVHVEDRLLGVTPMELDGLRPGRMALTLRLAGYLPEPLTVEIEPNAETTETLELIDLNRIFRPAEVDDLPVAREQIRPETNIPIIREESVMARFVVNRDGIPENIEITSSTNNRLNNVVIEAVRGWRFEPAKLRGESVRISLGAPFVFQPAERPQDDE